MTPSRRNVLASLTICGGCAALGVRTAGAAAPPTPGWTDLGAAGDFTKPGIYDAFARQHKAMLIRSADRLIAASSLCTHKSCVLKKKDDTVLRCPCHQSEFDADGIVLSGKAQYSLPRYAIKLENGRVLIEKSKMFDERDWDDPAASVTFEPTK